MCISHFSYVYYFIISTTVFFIELLHCSLLYQYFSAYPFRNNGTKKFHLCSKYLKSNLQPLPIYSADSDEKLTQKHYVYGGISLLVNQQCCNSLAQNLSHWVGTCLSIGKFGAGSALFHLITLTEIYILIKLKDQQSLAN